VKCSVRRCIRLRTSGPEVKWLCDLTTERAPAGAMPVHEFHPTSEAVGAADALASSALAGRNLRPHRGRARTLGCRLVGPTVVVCEQLILDLEEAGAAGFWGTT
jgi:hypothetical protein